MSCCAVDVSVLQYVQKNDGRGCFFLLTWNVMENVKIGRKS